MHIKRSTFCLLTLLSILAGCSQTGWVRPGGGTPPSEMRTVASVGDKPLPIVSGEPGSSLRAETEEADLPETTGSRISGRVFDQRGKPVPNAKVRLADTGSPGGKVVNDTTKRDGAFTLRGLRSGASYVVIVEYQGGDGMMTGRAQAKAPQTDVRVSLQPRDSSPARGHASIRPARPRVEPISNIDPVDEESPDEKRAGGKMNDEDLDLPADDAAAQAPRKNLRLSRASDEVSGSGAPVRAGWNNVRQPSSTRVATAPPSRAHDLSEDDGTAPRSRGTSDATSELDDDGPNPLPPALDTAETGPERSAGLLDEAPIRVARSTTNSPSRARRRTTASALDHGDSRTTGIMETPGEREPGLMPEDILPGARVINPRSSAPIAFDEEPTSGSDSAPAPSNAKRSRSQATGRSSNPPAETEQPAPPDLNGASNASARPTWRELAHSQAQVPYDESIQRASGESRPGDRGVATVTGLTAATKPARPRLLGGSRSTVDDSAKQTICRFDPSERRLVELQLPGIDGKMVSLHDIDADLILLDFWGSWCAPCRTSIAHLSETQAKLKGKGFQVVGIACEKGASLQERQASAGKAVRDLGINYPVLLSNKDGSCPVQKALQIQFYPTMVLVARDGRVLAREQGATEATLARMDRAIASALK